MSGAILKEPVVPKDSESEEKHSLGHHDDQAVAKGNPAAGLPPDPDAHLSDEERAAIVSNTLTSGIVFRGRSIYIYIYVTYLAMPANSNSRIANSSGSSI